jgi:hypothetical protein
VDDLKPSRISWQQTMAVVGPLIGLLGYLRYLTR